MCCSKKSVRNAVLALFSMCFLVLVVHPVNARITPQGGSQMMVDNTAVAFRGVASDYSNAGESTWYYTDGSVNYMPDDGFCGEDSFVYEISDGALTDRAKVTIAVACPANLPPKLKDDTYSAMLNLPPGAVP